MKIKKHIDRNKNNKRIMFKKYKYICVKYGRVKKAVLENTKLNIITENFFFNNSLCLNTFISMIKFH